MASLRSRIAAPAKLLAVVHIPCLRRTFDPDKTHLFRPEVTGDGALAISDIGAPLVFSKVFEGMCGSSKGAERNAEFFHVMIKSVLNEITASLGKRDFGQ